MKKLSIAVLVSLLTGILAAQPITQAPPVTLTPLSSAGSVVSMQNPTESIEDSVQQTTVDSIWFAFPNNGASPLVLGYPTLLVKPKAAMTLKIWAFPCSGTYQNQFSTNAQITLVQRKVFDATGTADSLDLCDLTSGVSLAANTEYQFDFDTWKSGTSHPWGPCWGFLVKFTKTDANTEACDFSMYIQ